MAGKSADNEGRLRGGGGQDKGGKVRFTRAATLGGLSLALSAGWSARQSERPLRPSEASGPSNLSTSSFTNSFSIMSQFKSLAAAGHGKVAAILPDTVSSTRYVEFDQPDITKALTKAGLSSSQFVVQNALGSDATQLTDAQTDISNGATVLLVDPLDSGVGAQIESYAKPRGVKVIDYDRLTLGGSRAYYVSFNNVTVGKVMGQGLVSCVAAWHISKPQVVVMHGAVTDNNATLFAQGYDCGAEPVVQSEEVDGCRPHGRHLGSADSRDRVPGGLHRAPQRQLGVDPERRDRCADRHVPPVPARQAEDLPDHWAGRDADRPGQRPLGLPVRDGVQADLPRGPSCGRRSPSTCVRAQDPAQVAGERVGEGHDGRRHRAVGADVPTWVTTKNMNATVIKDNFVPASQLCAGQYQADCTAAGITP